MGICFRPSVLADDEKTVKKLRIELDLENVVTLLKGGRVVREGSKKTPDVEIRLEADQVRDDCEEALCLLEAEWEFQNIAREG